MIDSPAAQLIIETVAVKSRRRPISTLAISMMVGWPERTVRHYLSIAEQVGLVERPNGPKSGWAVKPVPRVVIVEGQLMLPGF